MAYELEAFPYSCGLGGEAGTHEWGSGIKVFERLFLYCRDSSFFRKFIPKLHKINILFLCKCSVFLNNDSISIEIK